MALLLITPELLIEATPGLELFHVPPDVASASVVP